MTPTSLTRPLILASASPRRAELLAQLQLSFQVCPSHTEEAPPAAGAEVSTWAGQIALEKAHATASLLPPDDALVLGADTVVIVPSTDPASPLLHGHPVRVLGKPRDADDARRMLRELSGRAHVVISAFAVLAYPEDTAIVDVVETRVRFCDLSERDIDEYVKSGEPLDKAGAYGIQGLGAVLVDGIDGDYFTVVGLPLSHLWRALAPWRVSPLSAQGGCPMADIV